MRPLNRTIHARTPEPAAGEPPGEAAATEGHAGDSKARRVAFRVLAAVTSLWLLAMMVFGLMEIVLMWLPRETLLSIVGDVDVTHRVHFMSFGVIAWTLLLGLLVQLRRPARREAPMLHALAITVGASVVFALSGTLGDWLVEELTLLAPLVLLTALHPRARQLVRMPTWDRPMTALAAVAAVPWLFFAVTQAQQQWRNVAGDTHAEMEHYAVVALLALLVIACSFIGSTSHSGWRLTAWIAVVAAVNYGLHSLVYPEPASAAAAPWAVAAIAWGVVYAVAIIRRSRVMPSKSVAPGAGRVALP